MKIVSVNENVSVRQASFTSLKFGEETKLPTLAGEPVEDRKKVYSTNICRPHTQTDLQVAHRKKHEIRNSSKAVATTAIKLVRLPSR